MSRRMELHRILGGIEGVKKAYFQPPTSEKMVYPCICYELSDKSLTFADDSVYNKVNSYSVQVIDPDPDTEIPDRLLSLPYCRFERSFFADNLNHYQFRVYY